MEFFDSGHLASGLGDLDAVADEDGLEVDAKQAGSRPRARTMLVTPSRSLRVENPARQRDIHRKVRERAQAERNSHTRFHQSYQSMSGLLAGWFEDSVFGLDNCPGIV